MPSADAISLFLPAIVGLLSLVAQVLMHFFLWNIRSIRAIAFPLFLGSVPLFLIVAFYTIWRAIDRGCAWLAVAGIAILAGLGLVGFTWLIVLFGGFEMK